MGARQIYFNSFGMKIKKEIKNIIMFFFYHFNIDYLPKKILEKTLSKLIKI